MEKVSIKKASTANIPQVVMPELWWRTLAVIFDLSHSDDNEPVKRSRIYGRLSKSIGLDVKPSTQESALRKLREIDLVVGSGTPTRFVYSLTDSGLDLLTKFDAAVESGSEPSDFYARKYDKAKPKQPIPSVKPRAIPRINTAFPVSPVVTKKPNLVHQRIAGGMTA